MQESASSMTASVFSFSGDGVSEKIMSFLSARELSSLRGVNKLFKRHTLEFANYLIDCITKTNHHPSSSSSHFSHSSTATSNEAARFKHLEDISNQNQTVFLICGYSDPYVKLNQLTGLTRFEASSCQGSDVKKLLSWKAGRSPSISRYGFGSCVHNGEIWICCGGNAYLEDVGSVERYDIASMKWSRLHSKLMGSGRELVTGTNMISYKGNLLQIGGFYDPNGGSDDEFDANSLRFVEHISIMREGCSSSSSLSSYTANIANVDDNIASVFSKADLSTSSSSGGGASSSTVAAEASYEGGATIDRANAFFEVFSEMGRLNVSRADPGLTVFNNKLYVCGGFSVNSDSPNEMEALKSVEYFDEDSKLWVLMEETMICGRFGSSFTVGPISNELYAIGGEMNRMDADENPEALLTIEKLDKVTKKWVIVASYPSARAESCASIVGTSIYVFGGGPNMQGEDVSNWDRYCTKTNTWLSVSVDKADRSFPSYRMFEEHNQGGSQLYPVSSLASRAVTWPPNSATYPDDN